MTGTATIDQFAEQHGIRRDTFARKIRRAGIRPRFMTRKGRGRPIGEYAIAELRPLLRDRRYRPLPQNTPHASENAHPPT